MSIIWKIILIGFVLIQTMIGTFLGWRVLELMKRVKQLQEDRNTLLEKKAEVVDDVAKLSNKLREKGIEIDKLEKERPGFDTFEKKIILVALNRPDVKAEMEKLHTSHAMKKTYKNLKEKIEKSFDD